MSGEFNDISEIAICASGAQKEIADICRMFYRVEEKDSTVEICDMLISAASKLDAIDIPRMSGTTGQVQLAEILRGLDRAGQEAEEICRELDGTLTGLYKHQELLKLFVQRLRELSKQLEREENRLSAASFREDDAARLIERRKRDIAASKLLALNCVKNAETKRVELEMLSGSINSLSANIIPLWRSQLAEAKISCGSAEVNRSIDTGSNIAAAIRDMIRKKLRQNFS